MTNPHAEANATARPIVLLDVNGVIDPLGEHPSTHVIVKRSWGNWLVPTKFPEYLQALQAVADVYWVSAWEEEANDVNDFFNLPHLPNVPFGARDMSSEWWKLYWVRQAMQDWGDRAIVWVDDEFDHTVFAFARSHTSFHPIAVSGLEGLTEEGWSALIARVYRLAQNV